MSLTLYYHPFTRSANVVWMLEEVGVPYQVHFVELATQEHKTPEFLAMNPMGKLPLLVDDETPITEVAAIGLYLADRYANGKLCPAPDDPRRGTYFRWAAFSPSVVEPGVSAHRAGWHFEESRVGWGNYEAMLDTVEHALTGKNYLLGEDFSMADTILGGTLAFFLQTEAIERRPTFTSYIDRLKARPAWQRAELINAGQRRALTRQ